MVSDLEYPNVSLPISNYDSYLKFLQFVHGSSNKNFLFFSPTDGSDETYDKIAQYFLGRSKIKTWMWERGINGTPIPACIGNGYEIVGAGIARVSITDKKIVATKDPLNDYKLDINISGLEEVVKSMPNWTLEIRADY